jgi:acyl-CoA thioesterase
MGAGRVQGSGARDGPRTYVRGHLAPPLRLGAVAALAAGAALVEDGAGQEQCQSGQDDHVDPPVVIRRAGVYRDCDGVLRRLAGRYGRAVEMPAELRGELDAMFRSGGLGGMLGFRLVDWAPGRAVVELRPTAAITNITGSVHGGVLYTMADSAFEVACNSYGRVCVALDVSVHHATPAPVGQPLVAEAVEVTRSARVASYRITATGADGEVRAWYQATAYRTSRWHLGDDRWPATWRAAH